MCQAAVAGSHLYNVMRSSPMSLGGLYNAVPYGRGQKGSQTRP